MPVIAVKRIGLCILACVLALMFAEAALRISGWIYLRQHRAALPPETVRPQLRILCVGDSFTFGIGAPAGSSYPDQLRTIVLERSPGLRCEVINEGIPGQNSSQVADSLEEQLIKYRSNVVVVMAGCNDAGNLAQSKYYLFDTSLAGLWFRLEANLAKLRVWQVARHGVVKLRRRTETAAGLPFNAVLSSEPAFLGHMKRGKQLRDAGKFHDALAAFRKAAEVSPGDHRPYLALGEIYRDSLKDMASADNAMQQALRCAPGDADICMSLWEINYLLGRAREADRYIREAVRLNPRTLGGYSPVFRYGTPVLRTG